MGVEKPFYLKLKKQTKQSIQHQETLISRVKEGKLSKHIIRITDCTKKGLIADLEKELKNSKSVLKSIDKALKKL